ncbi:sensor histidine kinase [Polyangium jinanense]|uniref:histidine kinase n=1 Tax=Polyangium jinanense TaxID=2829994 RepID=A0A9X4AQ78_9BACT|nr:ATP-binding protein [Polyangium jinanense]MDC3954521.1 HAMP domain-containing protein [Polyangium jinanense]MDC3980824.1 HAMP domain-containing protein [Polyangium jinanense]
MRPGIRLQLLVALGTLLVLAFLPLFFAVVSLHRASMAGVIPTAPLIRLLALYMGIFALALLIFMYLAMTRLVVDPIERLSRAAGRVAEGARRLELPRTGARELAELAESVSRMTERLRADEESLRVKIEEATRYAKELERAQERLVRSERLASVGRLAAGLAHEIGNPIAALLGFEELLLAGGLDETDERDFLQRMKRETERIHRILRDLLDFARPATSVRDGRPPEAFGSFTQALDAALALVKPQKALRDVDITIDVEKDLPLVALSEPRLVQVLLNLLFNAADAVPKPGGRIELLARRAPEGLRVEVRDNGPGVAPAIRDHLFEPFTTTKDVGKGTGLGLAVCRGLLESVGGSIGVEHGEEGAGARFSFTVPLAAKDLS